MANIDLSSLKFSSKETFPVSDLSAGQARKTLSDGNIITADLADDGSHHYAVRDQSGELLKAIYLEMQTGDIGPVAGQKLCQVCYTTEANEYRCVNIKCGSTVVVQTLQV
jgi:hypothetical protein